MAFDEMKKTVVTAIETRLNDKIIGTFSISWCLFNWKVIAIIVFPSSISLTDRFAALKELGYAGLHPYDQMLIYPALSTLLFIFAIAYFSLHLVSWETWIQNKKNLRREKLIEVVPIEEVNQLHKQINELRQEAHNSELSFENRGKQVKEREAEVAELKNKTANLEVQRNELQKAISEKEPTIALLTTEKEASAENLAKLQNEFDIQKSLLAETTMKLEEAERRYKIFMQDSDKIVRNSEELLANRESELRLMKETVTSFESKIAQQDSELKQLKKNSKPLTPLEQLEELLKPITKEQDVPETGREKFIGKVLDSLAKGLTEGLNVVTGDITMLIAKLRPGKISRRELFDLRNKLIAGQPDNLKAAMIIKKLSDAEKFLFPSHVSDEGLD